MTFEMTTFRKLLPVCATAALIVGCGASDRAGSAGDGSYDLVIANGRVMDPESGLDAIRSVGVIDGKIAAVVDGELTGDRVIDATGLVVSPGFIDLHAHGQTEKAYGLMVRDGVTSGFELEVGTGDVAAWYGEREGGQILNYGVSVGHIPLRIALFDDPGGLLPAGIGGSATATPDQVDEIERGLREGLAQGAVAVGFGSAYTPGAEMSEIERGFAVAGEIGASVHIHLRGGVSGLDSTMTAAERTGAPLHIVHLNSSAGPDIQAFIDRVQAAQDAGKDVTTETYPYGAGMTSIQSALFDDWESWQDDRFPMHQLVATGERATRQSFAKARAEGGMVIIHARTEEMTRTAVQTPLTMIASDGHIENGLGHPRTSGTYAKVLGRYVRDEGLITLMDALRKMTIQPTLRLQPRVPEMSAKGRLQVGADADITLFDPNTVIDRSTYEDAAIPSAGIPFVVIAGQVVVDEGTVTEARPGRAIRAPIDP
jgi:amidohydrolase family protein